MENETKTMSIQLAYNLGIYETAANIYCGVGWRMLYLSSLFVLLYILFQVCLVSIIQFFFFLSCAKEFLSIQIFSLRSNLFKHKASFICNEIYDIL